MSADTFYVKAMLEDLYALQRLTSTRIARALGIDVKRVRSFFSYMRSVGVWIKPDIDHRALGWRRCLVVLRGILLDVSRLRGAPFIRSALLSIPPATILVIDSLNGYAHDCEDLGARAVCMDLVIRSRPDPRLLEMAIRRELRKLAETVPRYEPPIALTSVGRADWLDLEILRVLNRDPSMKLLELARELGRRPRTVETHTRHAERAITGYRVSKIRTLHGDECCNYIIIATSSNPLQAARALVAHPYVVGCGTTANTIVIHVALPMKHIHTFTKTLTNIANIEIEEAYIAPNTAKYVAYVGSTTTGEYSPKQGFLAKTLKQTLQKILSTQDS